MKKVRLKERFENAVDAFFDDEHLGESQDLVFGFDREVSNTDREVTESPLSDKWKSVLKQVFLFAPGTFLLYILTAAVTWFAIVQPHSRLQYFPIVSLWIISFFMTLFGLGDVRKLKHLVIPGSVISIAMVVGAASTIFLGPGASSPEMFNAYFIPLVFVVPFLAKHLVDSEE